MTHDPLCPWAQDDAFNPRGECFLIEGSEPPISACELIAKVRINEREQVLADGPYFTSVVHHCCVELQELRANT